jgi:hypothetical protein
MGGQPPGLDIEPVTGGEETENPAPRYGTVLPAGGPAAAGLWPVALCSMTLQVRTAKPCFIPVLDHWLQASGTSPGASSLCRHLAAASLTPLPCSS